MLLDDGYRILIQFDRETDCCNNNDKHKPYSIRMWSQRSLPFKPLEKKEGRNNFADKQTNVVELVTFDSAYVCYMACAYHSYFTISVSLIYMDPDYNSPLIYWWGYCNLSIPHGNLNWVLYIGILKHKAKMSCICK